MTNGPRAVDTRKLKAGLINYRDSLQKHLVRLRSEYQQLDNRWRAFDAVAAGDYADQFRSGWSRTKSQFESYIQQSEKMIKFLNDRIPHLPD